MKKLLTIFYWLITTSAFSQTLPTTLSHAAEVAPLTISNKKVTKGVQIGDTLISNGDAVFNKSIALKRPATGSSSDSVIVWDATTGKFKKVSQASISSGGIDTTHFWNTSGNASTNPATDFIGTTDNKSFRIRTNNVERMIVDSLGNVGLGSTTPIGKFDLQNGIYTNALRLIIDSSYGFQFNINDSSTTYINKIGVNFATSSLGVGTHSDVYQTYLTTDANGGYIENHVIRNEDNANMASYHGDITGMYLSSKNLALNFVDSSLIRLDSNQNVGIGFFNVGYNPQSRLHINGSVTIQDGTQGEGKVLTSDANGLSHWQSLDTIFTPAIIDSTNASGITVNTDAMAMITGRLITVQYSLLVTPTVTLTPTQIKVSLPIAANPSATPNGQGVFEDTGGNTSAIVKAVDANTISVDWTPVSTSPQLLNFNVTYRYQ